MVCGYQASKYRLDQERAERVRITAALTEQAAGIKAMKTAVATVLESASAGLQSSFGSETEAARRWLASTVEPATDREALPLNALRQAVTDLAGALDAGRQMHGALVSAYTESAGRMGQEVAERIAALEGELASGDEIIRLWLEDRGNAWARVVRDAGDHMRNERYDVAVRILAEAEQEVADQIPRARQREQQHQDRLYTLKAVRQLCADFGFREIGSPRRAEPADRGSPITLVVDPFDQSQFEWKISLDKIECEALTSGSHALAELGQFQKRLKEQFGVEVDFPSADADDPDILTTFDALRMPTDRRATGGRHAQ